MEQAFPKAYRLRKRPQFVAVQKYGRRLARDGLLFLLQRNGLPQARLGLSVTRKTWPLATTRNRLRRLLREAFRLNYHLLPAGWDIVVVITRRAWPLNLRTAETAILWAARQACQKQS